MLSLVPSLDWLRSYQKEWLRFDVVAGLTAAAVVIPKAMAYATIAGLPVETGLYAALVPMLVYALLGTSRTLSVSSTSTIAILVAAPHIPLQSRRRARLHVGLQGLASRTARDIMPRQVHGTGPCAGAPDPRRDARGAEPITAVSHTLVR